MNNGNTRQSEGLSFLPRYSDPDILRSIVSTPFWKHLFQGERGKASWIFFRMSILLKINLLSLPLVAILRYGQGKATNGLITLVLCCLMMLGFNSNSPVFNILGFTPYILPIPLILQETSEILLFAYNDIRSTLLVKFINVFMVVSIWNLLNTWVFDNAASSSTYRGSSWMHTLVFKRLGVSQNVIQLIVEPVLVFYFGYYMWSNHLDITFGIYLMLASSSLFLQECYNSWSKFIVAR